MNYVRAASMNPAGSRIVQAPQETKVFWFFSSEKNTCLPLRFFRLVFREMVGHFDA